VLGGYVVLGVTQVDKRAGTWAVDGWIPPDETHQWLTDCIRGHVDPPPTFEVESFKLEDGRAVAVVRVWSAPVPPCITSEGYVLDDTIASIAREALRIMGNFEWEPEA
jgi:hypothetical protein